MADWVFHVRLPPALRAAVLDRAEADGVSASQVCRRALEEFLGVGPVTEGAAVMPRPREPSPRPKAQHLHRMVATGASKFEQGQRVELFRCECGHERWGR